ncbi:hypothetical protein [Niveispirillum sp. BGYR6]|uniref:hypothetical protein n=1 Tax=Niveispirillum sp. BGYR6 TaxID=2971249 RepID=UPI0022B991F5|nr:hypothetical protein [Niveispirillum sp. BGYR6]MDG5496879.1 hypothetical protein [Niveispirillum sp. BGYR6]
MPADPQWLAPAHLAVPTQRLALRHWLSLRPAGRDMPDAGLVDLLDWPGDALPHLSLVRGRPGLDRLQLDFIGNMAALFSGATQGGRYMDEFYPLDQMSMVTGFFTLPARARGPVLVHDQFALPAQSAGTVRVERLSLPFQGADGTAGLFITLHYFKLLDGTPPQRLRLIAPGVRLLAREVWQVQV